MRREKSKRQNPRGESTDAGVWGGPIRTSVDGPVMGSEQRDRGQVVVFLEPTGNRMTSTGTTNKPFRIEKRQVYEAYKAVKSNRGAAGADGQTLEVFETDLAGNLYKIWNRMSSGTYFPPPVRAVSIPKKVWRTADFGCAHSSGSRGADGGQASH
jgi:hypothetical protein